ncbi:hypothetical protein [uncultured Tateyamaria sp.]|uniref:hypothetical protein n=1 Tax=uncultured Tateyamaria sp. TaxID=455651 RepID=UPI002613191B|nr:hypothetical protein [uncultured Tateyamaria sp.]
MIRPALVALLLLSPVAAFAQSQLERFEALSEQINLERARLLVREMEAIGGDARDMQATLPDTGWGDEDRVAGACVLEQYNTAAGTQGTDEMLDRMEAALPQLATAESLAQLTFRPDAISDRVSVQIEKSCGLFDIPLRQMKDSGFTNAMMQAFDTAKTN